LLSLRRLLCPYSCSWCAAQPGRPEHPLVAVAMSGMCNPHFPGTCKHALLDHMNHDVRSVMEGTVTSVVIQASGPHANPEVPQTFVFWHYTAHFRLTFDASCASVFRTKFIFPSPPSSCEPAKYALSSQRFRSSFDHLRSLRQLLHTLLLCLLFRFGQDFPYLLLCLRFWFSIAFT
jgi:hypothetical protein